MIYSYISEHPPVEWLPTVTRHNVLCILRHRSDDTYGVLRRTTINRRSRVMGWVDDDDLVTAGMREISEETGYTDIRHIQTLDHEIHAQYHAPHKGVNRYSIERCAVYQLTSWKKHADPLDDEHHDFLWLPADDVEAFLSDVPWLSSNLAFWYQWRGEQQKRINYIATFENN